MTREFHEVDHDLLADYVGGALDGTPEEATVARLVDEEPAWADAYALLAPAVADVRADLSAWGATALAMPPEVTDRLTAALARAEDRDGAAGAGATPDRHTGSPVPAQPLGGRRPEGVPRPAPDQGTAAGPGRRRRRWTRLAGPVALATVSIAVAGLGLQQLAQRGDDATTTSDAARPEVAAPAAGTPFRTTGPLLSTGTDYSAEALSEPPAAQTRQFASKAPAGQPGVTSEDGRVAGPIGLDRLHDPAAIDACLTAVTAEHGDAPIVVDTVDFARFRGEPALVVWFTDAAGARWSWASGPECGIPGSGSDVRFRTRVG
ncbi:hypothetical protein [Micromonospora endolithica]|uniref:Uncharacterized protein n=1 Tax=Micromonospora endolithica TaxID=230091 RepID=A0A3A9ZG73_9ACTN|nr:hypothetical protein [Micromonospora endolithica]RKN46327.1 hypothetical protein D7223_15540 [Micromonospora endolithica]TWJ24938.1 hypothetical protein JD76_05098 [Micromonospora endolithica]